MAQIDFGLQIEPQFGFSYENIKSLALECEKSGFQTLWCSDHLFLDRNSARCDCLECFTVLTALSLDTKRLRLGAMTACVHYRTPSMLAKIAACVDVLSNGRLEFGIGAGWKELEYKAYGYTFPPPSERVSQLDEAIRIIRAMWTQEKASHKGRYYQIEDAFCAPKPVQKPHPQIWVGGSRRRIMGIAAELADGVNVNGMPDAEAYRSAMKMLREHCARIGRDYTKIEKSHFPRIVVAGSKKEVDSKVERLAKESGKSAEAYVKDRNRDFIGTSSECVEYLQEFVDMGVKHFTFMFPYGSESESVRLMSEEVLPKL